MPGEESWGTSLIVGGGRKPERRPETLRERGWGDRGSVCVAAMKPALEGWQGRPRPACRSAVPAACLPGHAERGCQFVGTGKADYLFEKVALGQNKRDRNKETS